MLTVLMMMMVVCTLSLLSLLTSITQHAFAAQPSAPKPIPAQLRDLEWGQLNFLHTTDTHGWLAGHLQEPFYSADWGDYVSFTTRMREKAEAQGQDLLVIDTGDRVEGNGLWDSSEPKGVYVSEILCQQPIDVITIGNHELYKQYTSEAEFYTTVHNFRGHYLASNVDIIHPVTKDAVPFAPRYKKFTTKQQGIRIVAFGFLFDFNMNHNNTIVQRVADTIEEEWFQEAIRDTNVDLFLVAGHIPVHSQEAEAIFKAIRAVRWDVPIQFFGGHYHIRDYARYDDKAYGLASGRFLETIGFMSIDGLSTGTPRFSRRYIDNNLFSFYHHTGLDDQTFPTEHGQNTSQLIQESRSALRLDQVYGCAPRDLWMSSVEYPSESNIYTWLEKEVIPDALKDDKRSGKPAVAIVNTGAIRFDLFKGPFTQDSLYILCPFTSGFRYLKDVPYDKAQLIVEVLNEQPQILLGSQHSAHYPIWSFAPPEQAAYLHDIVVSDDDSRPSFASKVSQALLSWSSQSHSKPKLLPGYTTKDDGGSDGDDTIHSPISFYRVPNCIQASVSSNSSATPDTVDLVYIDFIERYITLAAKIASFDIDVPRNSDVYMPSMSLTNLILGWVKDNWKCDTTA